MAAYANPFPTAPGMPGAPGAKPPGPSGRVSILLIVAGLALAIPTFIVGLLPIIHTLSATPFTPDTPHALQLGSGTYELYEDTGSQGLGVNFSSGFVTITPNDVTVTSATGENVPVYGPGVVNETITRNSRRYTGAVRFTTPAAGSYVITINSSKATSVIVARPFSDTVTSSLGWFALAGLGGVVFVVGVVLLIVGSVRRSRTRNMYAFAAPAYAPGWYPDPHGTGRQRYWDGARWTEHLS